MNNCNVRLSCNKIKVEFIYLFIHFLWHMHCRQWLSEDQLCLLGVDANVDNKKLMESRSKSPTKHSDAQAAFKRAKEHIQLLKEPIKTDGGGLVHSTAKTSNETATRASVSGVKTQK